MITVRYLSCILDTQPILYKWDQMVINITYFIPQMIHNFRTTTFISAIEGLVNYWAAVLRFDGKGKKKVSALFYVESSLVLMSDSDK